MSFLLDYIPWWYSSNVNNNQDNQNNNNNTEQDIPLSSQHDGEIILYYNCSDSSTYYYVSSYQEPSEVSENIESIWGIFKWAFNDQKVEKIVQGCESILSQIKKLIQINSNVISQIKQEDQEKIKYGDINEYNITPDLSGNVLRRIASNHNSERIYRVLWTIKWKFHLSLGNDNSQDNISKRSQENNLSQKDDIKITDTELNKVTKNIEKLSIYISYKNKYDNLIKDGISFRKKYYNNLCQNISINHLDEDFFIEMLKLYRDIIECFKTYQEFIKSLNWFEENRYNEYKKNIVLPKISINFSLYNKNVQC